MQVKWLGWLREMTTAVQILSDDSYYRHLINFIVVHMEVSWNGGLPPNHPFLWDFPLWTIHFLGYPHFMETFIYNNSIHFWEPKTRCFFLGSRWACHSLKTVITGCKPGWKQPQRSLVKHDLYPSHPSQKSKDIQMPKKMKDNGLYFCNLTWTQTWKIHSACPSFAGWSQFAPNLQV